MSVGWVVWAVAQAKAQRGSDFPRAHRAARAGLRAEAQYPGCNFQALAASQRAAQGGAMLSPTPAAFQRCGLTRTPRETGKRISLHCPQRERAGTGMCRRRPPGTSGEGSVAVAAQ